MAGLERAQQLAGVFTQRSCPVVKQFGRNCRGSLDQVGFATDIVFAGQADWRAIHDPKSGSSRNSPW
jgi:hypothetical protein